MEPKISVIVPVYKAEEYLPRCVDSILSQSFTDFELILVDDGSPDNCGKICDEYAQKDSRVRVFHKPNGGVSSARNLGLDNAKGEWITFIDSDDYIEQGFFSIPKDTPEDLLIQNYKVLKNEECKIFEFEKVVIPYSKKQSWINENIVKQICRVPWAKFFKNIIIKNNKLSFIEGVKIGEDSLFVYDYLHIAKSVKFLGVANYVYIDSFSIHKYQHTIDKSIEGIQLMMERYNKLNANCNAFLLFIFLFYYNLINPKNYKTLKKWKKNTIVSQIYSAIYLDLGFLWNLTYKVYPIYKMHNIYVRFKKLLYNQIKH